MSGEELLVEPFAITLFLGIFSLISLYWYTTLNFDYWKKRGIPYVTPTLPFLGSLFPVFWKPTHDVDLERCQKLGPVYGQFFGNTPVLSVADPKLLREILVKQFPSFVNRRLSYVLSGDPLMDSMMFFLRGEEWKRVRGIVTPNFTTGKIKKMINILKECGLTTAKNIKTAAKSGKPLEVKQFFNAFTMDVIASTFFSLQVDSYNDPKNKFVECAYNAFSPSLNIKNTFHQLFPKLAKLIGVQVITYEPLHYFKEVILHIMEQRRKLGETRKDFLEFLMTTVKEDAKEQKGNERNDKNGIKSNYGQNESTHQVNKNIPSKYLDLNTAVAQGVLFFIAGFDTVSATISNVAYILALYPEIQKRMYEEIRDVLQKTEGELSYDALQEMTYLDSVLCETLRLYPAFARLDRRAEANCQLGDTGIVVSKGMNIMIPIYAMQRDPKLFPDPEKFDPDRFSPEKRADIVPYSYLPFGDGPRVCIGMRFSQIQVKTCIACVIANFKILRCPETKVPLEYRLGTGPIAPKLLVLKFEERTDKIPLK